MATGRATRPLLLLTGDTWNALSKILSAPFTSACTFQPQEQETTTGKGTGYTVLILKLAETARCFRNVRKAKILPNESVDISGPITPITWKK
jgi:hypothetical protein